MEIRYRLQNGRLINVRYDNEFLEEEHPRGENGRFINKDTINVKQANAKMSKMEDEDEVEDFLHRLPLGSTITMGDTTITKDVKGWAGRDESLLAINLFRKEGQITSIGKWELPPIPPVKQNTKYTDTSDKRVNGKRLSLEKLTTLFKLQTGVDLKTAKEMVGLITDYTGDHFMDVKAFERTGTGNKDEWIKLNQAIDLMPKTKGKLWRGVGLTKRDIKALKVGARVKLNGLASFTSKQDIAVGFASANDTDTTPVIFELNDGIHRGANITAYSQMKRSEGETLMHSQAQFTIEGWEEKEYEIDGYTEKYLTVYLNEDYKGEQ